MKEIELSEVVHKAFKKAPFDKLSLAKIDFNSGDYTASSFHKSASRVYPVERELNFDLASLTKPLTNGLLYLQQEDIFEEKDLLLLNHRAGLKSWAILSRTNWIDYLKELEIKESETEYSDLSSLALMLRMMDRGINYSNLVKEFYGNNMKDWRDSSLSIGDPNARNLGVFCTHAGLVSSAPALCQALLKLSHLSNWEKLSKKTAHRFRGGWDSVSDSENTLAGKGCSQNTFGHLGFSGTSMWIDPDKQLGCIVLANATDKYWYEKKELNIIRRSFGEFVWG